MGEKPVLWGIPKNHFLCAENCDIANAGFPFGGNLFSKERGEEARIISINFPIRRFDTLGRMLSSSRIIVMFQIFFISFEFSPV